MTLSCIFEECCQSCGLFMIRRATIVFISILSVLRLLVSLPPPFLSLPSRADFSTPMPFYYPIFSLLLVPSVSDSFSYPWLSLLQFNQNIDPFKPQANGDRTSGWLTVSSLLSASFTLLLRKESFKECRPGFPQSTL